VRRWLEHFAYHWPRGAGFLINLSVIVFMPLAVLIWPLGLIAYGLQYFGLLHPQDALIITFGIAALVWVPWIVGAWKVEGFKL